MNLQKVSLCCLVWLALLLTTSLTAPTWEKPRYLSFADTQKNLSLSGPITGPGILRYLPPEPYRKTVEFYCAEQGLYVDMVCRLIWEESRWDFTAENHSGELLGRGVDRNLMQINSRNWEAWCLLYNGGVVGDPKDPQVHLKVGIRCFGEYVRLHGYRLAYIRWNAGQLRLTNPPETTKKYVRRIFS